MDDNKLPHSILGTVITWLLTVVTWFSAHIGIVTGLLAIVATAYSIWASWETIKLRRAQRRQIESRHHHHRRGLTSGGYKEPENDL